MGKRRIGEMQPYEVVITLIIMKDIKDPRISGIDKNRNIVARYIGCLTIPYNPVSTTFWFSCTSIVRDKYVFSLNTSAYMIYAIMNKTDAIITTELGSIIQLYL